MWLYVVPLILFTALGNRETLWYEISYYNWDKGKDFIYLFIIYYTLSEGKRIRLYPVVIISFLRFLWELIAAIFKASVSFPYYVDWLFYALVVFTIILTIKDLRKNVKKINDSSS